MIAELQNAGVQEVIDRFTSLLKLAPMGDKARTFDGEHKALRNLRRPFAKRRRRLRAVERAVDLNRGEMARRIAEFLRMRQAGGIEYAAPRRKSPSADADVDVAGNVLEFWHGVCPIYYELMRAGCRKARLLERPRILGE